MATPDVGNFLQGDSVSCALCWSVVFATFLLGLFTMYGGILYAFHKIANKVTITTEEAVDFGKCFYGVQAIVVCGICVFVVMIVCFYNVQWHLDAARSKRDRDSSSKKEE